MKEFWNERYAKMEYAYGTDPNVYFKDVLERYKVKGNILLPGEGEGRNGVYAAQQGLEVMAFDISLEGQKKAMKLAREKQVNIQYKVGNLFDFDFDGRQFDTIALIYAHFAADKLREYHSGLRKLLKPGGLLILEGFSKNHLEMQKVNPQAGGPKDADMLFTVESIMADFTGLEVLELKETEVSLSEGPYHNGLSRVVRFVGRKPA